nr:MAG TPA: hypothetical protein [Bacteriophage sp.]
MECHFFSKIQFNIGKFDRIHKKFSFFYRSIPQKLKMGQPNNCNHFTGKKRFQTTKKKKVVRKKKVHVNKYRK